MRSRNGNRPFLLKSIGIISTFAFGADNYYIGYRLTAHNSQVFNETLSISKAMQPCSSQPLSSITFDRLQNESLKKVLLREETRFLQFSASQEISIKSNETITPSTMNSQQTLTLPTKCYEVEFNDRSVTITLMK
ncbi:MAG: hypothetical protein PHW64_02605 [Sulfuricurvum sp.]|nr:hypothetical protein [Sulfuricurvum sp.]